MDHRTQSLPPQWQKSKLAMTAEPKQGPAQTSRPTARDLTPTGNFTTDVIASRPGAIHQRALAPIPGDIQTVLADAPGSFIEQTFCGGSFDAQRAKPGDDSNTDGSSQGGTKFAQGSATKTTGGTVMGKTVGGGMI